jgi:hypothetical protein
MLASFGETCGAPPTVFVWSRSKNASGTGQQSAVDDEPDRDLVKKDSLRFDVDDGVVGNDSARDFISAAPTARRGRFSLSRSSPP